VRSKPEECLAAALESNPLHGWDLVREYQFDPTRRWSFDFAFPSQKLAAEVEGQRHRTFKGHREDCEKMNQALVQGWRVLRFPADQTRHVSEWVEIIHEALCGSSSPSAPSTSGVYDA
jgi:very-short-patch-repair endonuclease